MGFLNLSFLVWDCSLEKGASFAMLATIFLSNFPEGTFERDWNAASREKQALCFWSLVSNRSIVRIILARALPCSAGPHLATVNAVAAGALLTMVVNTMIPEAVEGNHKATAYWQWLVCW
jgi:ZIP family zinc transporter